MSKCKLDIEKDIKEAYIKKVLPYINSKDTLVLDSSESKSYLELTNKGSEYPQTVNRLLYTINTKLELNFGKLDASKTKIDINVPTQIIDKAYSDFIEFDYEVEDALAKPVELTDNELSEQIRIEQDEVNMDITDDEFYTIKNSNLNTICK